MESVEQPKQLSSDTGQIPLKGKLTKMQVAPSWKYCFLWKYSKKVENKNLQFKDLWRESLSKAFSNA